MEPANPTLSNVMSLTAVDRLTEVLIICSAEDPQSRRELAISDLHVVRDLVKRLTFPTSDTGWDAARALLLLDKMGMLATASLGTAAARQQRPEPQRNPSPSSSAGTGKCQSARPGVDPGGMSFPPVLRPVTGEAVVWWTDRDWPSSKVSR